MSTICYNCFLFCYIPGTGPSCPASAAAVLGLTVFAELFLYASITKFFSGTMNMSYVCTSILNICHITFISTKRGIIKMLCKYLDDR